jgi:sugar phosphate isomerase/epimerase
MSGLACPAVSGQSTEGEEERWKIGIYTRPWDQFDYRVALDAIAESGYRYVGLMTTKTAGRRLVIDATLPLSEAEHVSKEIRQRELVVCSVYGGEIPVDESQTAAIEGLKRLIDNCVAVNAKSLLMGGIGRSELFEPYYRAIAACCDYAAERNLPITVKPHGGLNATGKECRKCIELVGHPNFSLWYDPGNILYYSQGVLNPIDDARDVAGLVRVGISVKDFCFRQDGNRKVPDVLITPGQGQVDFGAVMRELVAGGFHAGSLVVETVGTGSGTRPEILKQAQLARTFVEDLVQEL